MCYNGKIELQKLSYLLVLSMVRVAFDAKKIQEGVKMEIVNLSNVQFEGVDDEETKNKYSDLLEEMLNQAENLNLDVEVVEGERSEGSYRGPYQITVKDPCPLDPNELMGNYVALNEPIRPSTIAELIQLCRTKEFAIGLQSLESRIIALGWTSQYDSRNRWRIGIDINSDTRYSCNPEGLLDLSHDIEVAELMNRLRENDAIFKKAGITLERRNNVMEIQLAENDPAIKRRLSPQNVEWIIAVARLMAEHQ